MKRIITIWWHSIDPNCHSWGFLPLQMLLHFSKTLTNKVWKLNIIPHSTDNHMAQTRCWRSRMTYNKQETRKRMKIQKQTLFFWSKSKTIYVVYLRQLLNYEEDDYTMLTWNQPKSPFIGATANAIALLHYTKLLANRVWNLNIIPYSTDNDKFLYKPNEHVDEHLSSNSCLARLK